MKINHYKHTPTKLIIGADIYDMLSNEKKM